MDNGDSDAKAGRAAVELQELVERLSGARAITIPLRATERDGERLADLIDRTAIKVPAKYRVELLRLERKVRAEVERAIVSSIEMGNAVAGGGAARWAYQSGALTAHLLHFLGRSMPPVSAPLGRPLREQIARDAAEDVADETARLIREGV